MNQKRVHEVFLSEKLKHYTEPRFEVFLNECRRHGTLPVEKRKALLETRFDQFRDFKTESESQFAFVLKRAPLDKGLQARLIRAFWTIFFFGLPYFQDRYRNTVRPLTVELEVNDRLETNVTFIEWE